MDEADKMASRVFGMAVVGGGVLKARDRRFSGASSRLVDEIVSRIRVAVEEVPLRLARQALVEVLQHVDLQEDRHNNETETEE